jgi:DNA-binding transcriptional ArsR family regulator
MPAPDPDVVASIDSPIRIALEPAHHALHSLMLLYKAEKLSGLDEWVTRTAAALTPEQRRKNDLVTFGLYFAVVPDQSWPSFPAYINHLAGLDPTILRDRVFNAYSQVCKNDDEHCAIPDPASDQAAVDTAPLLASVDAFLDFLRERFPPENVIPEIESEAHRYLNDPPAMQSLIVSHLRNMWDEILASEWYRVMPMLQASVEAFQQLNLGTMSKSEAARLVLDHDLDEHKRRELEGIERLVFVPSAHLGPYLGKFKFGDTLWVLFGARIPAGVQVYAPDLSRTEILVRLSALADDTRLRILKLVAEEGEQSSQDIMTHLELSQSAASRHLKQLHATGYLDARRCNGAKCFKLNSNRVENTLRALSLFLLGK